MSRPYDQTLSSDGVYYASRRTNEHNGAGWDFRPDRVRSRWTFRDWDCACALVITIIVAVASAFAFGVA